MIKIPRHLGKIAKQAGCIGASGRVKTNKGGVCRFRSLLELKCIKLLEQSKNVKSFKVEPFSIPYEVKAGNRIYRKKYKPDFLVEFVDNTKAVLEIKPVKHLSWKLNLYKWEAAKKILDKYNIKFYIIDDKKLKDIL